MNGSTFHIGKHPDFYSVILSLTMNDGFSVEPMPPALA
jgi:hypothetical protein